MFNLYSEETKQVVNQLKKLMAGKKRRQKNSYKYKGKTQWNGKEKHVNSDFFF